MMESNSLLEKKEFALKSVSYIRPIDTIVILSSLTALYLFRLQDGHQLNPNWQLKRPSNSQHIIQGHHQSIEQGMIVAGVDTYIKQSNKEKE